jgi:DNA-binding GntR family transcriptional regulator
MGLSISANSQRLAKHILNLIREAQYLPGYHLREQHLADQLKVSRTPIRHALRCLCELGVLESRPNQGFFVKQTAQQLAAMTIRVPASNEQDLYHRLVADHLAGHLPQWFTQRDIATRYCVDRSILARTLLFLSQDGIIVRNQGQGWRFSPILGNDSTLRQGYEFRLMIEPHVILSPLFHIEHSVLKQLRKRHDDLLHNHHQILPDQRDVFDTDAVFHETLAQASGNTYIVQAIQKQNRLRSLLSGAYYQPELIAQWGNEHLAIIDALLQGDFIQAAQLMCCHLHSSLAILSRTPDKK